MKIIENSERSFRVVDYRGVGMATFYTREAAEEYIKMKESYEIFMGSKGIIYNGSKKE